MKRILAFVIISGFFVNSSFAGDWHYYYFDQKIPLTLDVTRIAVFQKQSSTSKDQNGAISFLESTVSSTQVSDVKPMQITGWFLADSSSSIKSQENIVEVLEVLENEQFSDYVSPVFIDELGGPLIVTQDILVGFHEGVSAEKAEQMLLNIVGGTVLDRNWNQMKGAYRIRSHATNGTDVLIAANALAIQPEVKYAEPDMIFSGTSSLIPNDPGFFNCWGIHNIGQFGPTPDMDMDGPEAWDITTGDPSVLVVVIDTGVEQSHPDIHQIGGADFTSDSSTNGGPVNACDNHGTPVAGCISATINNGIGTVGIAPGCRSASARTFISNLNCSGNWNTFTSWTVNALSWAETIGAKVTNNSNGYGFTSSAIAQKYSDTRNAGIIHFASAGNEGSPFFMTYPSTLPSVNAVAALQPNGTLASFSNRGVGLAFSAPGVTVYTTDRSGSAGWTLGDYTFASGTSFASPYTAGVAALYFSLNPGTNSIEVEQILQATAVDLGSPGYDTTYGWGFVNAHNALQLATLCNLVTEPLAEPVVVGKSRYLSFIPGNSGNEVAIRIELTNLDGFNDFNGQNRWVGPPSVYQEGTTAKPTFIASGLQCIPHYQNWGDIELLHVYGAEIIPSSEYTAQIILADCDTAFETSYSNPLIIETGKWGDIIAPFEGVGTQPTISDVLSIVDKWLGNVNPIKARAQLRPNIPNPAQAVSIADVLLDVGAWLGSPYSFDGPGDCP